MPDQTPKTSLLHSAILAIGLIAASGVHAWWSKSETVKPVAPVVVDTPVVVAPATIDPQRTLATKDDNGLTDKDRDTVIALALIGDGRYELVSTPVGAKKIVKQIVVSTISDNVKPVEPTKPVDPPKPVQPNTKPTAAIYFYEKDQTAIPPYVSAGLNQINRKGIDATLFEVDTKSSTGQIPERFRVPHAEAVKAGVPVLVIVSGQIVTKVIKSPKSLEEITGAVQ